MNSPNLGPYGDAVHYELLPAIDQAFRTIGQPWGRTVTGGSTGGWVSAATMVKYPGLFAGSWPGFPDSPPARFQFVYGFGQPHDWYPVSMPDMFTTMADFIARHAPAGTETSGWRGTQQPPALMLTPGRQIVDGGIVMYGA